MIRMLIVGHCYGLRSERRRAQEAELHLAYCWFCQLDLDDKVLITRLFRRTDCIGSGVFRHVFERVVATCMAAGLVIGEGFAVDASVMEANASRFMNFMVPWVNARSLVYRLHARLSWPIWSPGEPVREWLSPVGPNAGPYGLHSVRLSGTVNQA
jgi:hypothetical protein